MDGEYATVREHFNAAMKNALSLRKLKSAWEGVAEEAGAFIGFDGVETLPGDEHHIYLVTTRHENRDVVTRVVFDAESGLITGLHFRFSD